MRKNESFIVQLNNCKINFFSCLQRSSFIGISNKFLRLLPPPTLNGRDDIWILNEESTTEFLPFPERGFENGFIRKACQEDTKLPLIISSRTWMGKLQHLIRFKKDKIFSLEQFSKLSWFKTHLKLISFEILVFNWPNETISLR